jgi:hypothetical protein
VLSPDTVADGCLTGAHRRDHDRRRPDVSVALDRSFQRQGCGQMKDTALSVAGRCTDEVIIKVTATATATQVIRLDSA